MFVDSTDPPLRCTSAGFALVGPNPHDDTEDTMMLDITHRVSR